jgi:maltose alpha-D-glucosyltransferase/alpha-amylase
MVNWLKDALFYEIYPQSFYDTNADGIGDLQGITEKLDYIKNLGCNALWINPCFESPFHDAGYDISDYRKIAPRYGTNEDMKRLFEKAHEKGIRVLLDLVPGHTSIDHEWFRESMKSDDNKYAGRYIWVNTPWERFQGIENICGGLNGICERGTVAVNFFFTQPALNYGFAHPEKPWQSAIDSPEAMATRQDIQDVMRFWLSMGCDGFRVDMAHSLIKGDPEQRETIRLWQDFRRFLDMEFPEAVLISEWGMPDRSLKAGFHMDFLLHFGPSHYNDLFRDNPYFSAESSGDLSAFFEYFLKVREAAGENGLICIPSGNHDMSRIAHKLTEKELKFAFAFILTMPGAPFIYYGDEIGMRYLDGLPSVEGGYERTGSRSPMQWDKTLNAGFSSAKPEQLYITIDPNPGRPDVKGQLAEDNSLLSEVKKLTGLRHRISALGNTASFELLSIGKNDNPLVYRRSDGEATVYAAFNPGKRAMEYAMPEIGGIEPIHSIGGEAEFSGSVLTIPPGSFMLFKALPG